MVCSARLIETASRVGSSPRACTTDRATQRLGSLILSLMDRRSWLISLEPTIPQPSDAGNLRLINRYNAGYSPLFRKVESFLKLWRNLPMAGTAPAGDMRALHSHPQL